MTVQPVNLIDLIDLIGYSHGRLHYVHCVHCGNPLVRSWHGRNGSHEYRTSCPTCHWLLWESEHEADMRQRTGATQQQLDAVCRWFQREEDRAAAEVAVA